MAGEMDDNERSEEATDYRREEFRRRGQVAQTRELSSVLIMLGAVLGIWFFGQFFLNHIHELFVQSFGDLLVNVYKDQGISKAIAFVGRELFMLLFPVGLILLIVGLVKKNQKK